MEASTAAEIPLPETSATITVKPAGAQADIKKSAADLPAGNATPVHSREVALGLRLRDEAALNGGRDLHLLAELFGGLLGFQQSRMFQHRRAFTRQRPQHIMAH